MILCRRTAILVTCLAMQAGISCADAAEWINFYPVTGEVSLGFDGRWRENDPGESTWRTEYEEKLNLAVGGYILDRRFFTFSADLAPAFSQMESDATGGVIETDENFLNYGARFSLLHGVSLSPVSLNGSFSASDGDLEDNLGNRREITQENRLAGMQIKFRPFRSSIFYRESSLEESFISAFGQPPTDREEFQRALTYKGQSRGMELFLEGTEFDDRTIDDRDYESYIARLSNNFGWGKNSRLSSRLEYRDREGFSAEERASVSESLRLQHTQNLYTTYDYAYAHTQRLTETERHTGRFQLNHKLYTNLDTSFKLSGSNTESSQQYSEQTREGSLDFSYNKKLRSDMRVSANLGGGYRATERDGGQIDYNESIGVPATGIVVLSLRYVIWSSIFVTAPGCNPCLDGSDYIVEDAGSDFTQLRIPLGSRIAIGDTITVDYLTQPPTVEFYGIPYRVGVKLEYGPFQIYHRTSGEEQTYVSGPDPATVGDRRTDVTGLNWQWSRGRAEASASIERVYSVNFERDSTEYFLVQSLKYAVAPNARFHANFRETFYRNNTDAESYNGLVRLNWLPAPRLSVTPELSAFRRNTDQEGSNTILRGSLDVAWKWRAIALDFSYDHTRRDTNGNKSIEDRVLATVKRKF